MGEITIALIPAPILQALRELDLCDPGFLPEGEALAGGVSSDIWRIDLLDRTICAKRALPKLKVSQDWYAPVERAAQEAAFNSLASTHRVGQAPTVLGFHAPSGTMISEYFPPEQNPVWKHALRDGTSTPRFAAHVADFLAMLYRETKGSASVRKQFFRPDLIHALRLEPYFLMTAHSHPNAAPPLNQLVDMFRDNCDSLIHGDFSPKNILCGSTGPIVLDAECANYGDPAFDAAFCLNHLCLKALWAPEHIGLFVKNTEAFLETYSDGIHSQNVIQRIAAYLPGLMLARIDGKSPVEYISAEKDKTFVRRFAEKELQSSPVDPSAVAQRWFTAVEAYSAAPEQERV